MRQILPVRAILLPLAALLAACAPAARPDAAASLRSGPVTAPAGMYRLTEAQYRNTIADVFGADIAVPGRFEPVTRRVHGLLTSGSYQIAASPSAMEQYSQMARATAAQVVDPKHRDVLMACVAPAADQAAKDACAATFFRRVGRYLFRQPLTDAEVENHVRIARESGQAIGDFYTGMALSLELMLVSPRFLFQIDEVEADPRHPGKLRLTGSARASRLSFFLWNTSPDDELLDAAARGDLHEPTKLARQVERMLASPRTETGVRAFFSDMLQLEKFDEVTKDAIVYPQFVQSVRRDMPEQTLRTITHVLLTQRRDYRELFTARDTFMTAALAQIYGIAFDPDERGWIPYEFAPASARAGIVTQLTFLSAFSHPGRSSPTLRGKALRELLLCQAVPDPPGDVDFTEFERTQTVLNTARDRLTAHSANPVCAGCHKITDPIGLALENFDAIGIYRTAERGAPLDTSATVSGIDVEDAVGLGAAISQLPATTACLVDRLVEYGTRQPPANQPWVEQLKGGFAATGYRVPDLLRTIASSEAFFSVPAEPGT